MARMVTILSYDICNNKRRRKVVKELEGVARRIQFSVFETYLNIGQLRQVVKRTIKHMSVKEGDSLLVYRLCEECAARRERFGGEVIDWESAIIIE